MIYNHKKVKIFALLVIIIAVVITLLASCKSCNPSSKPIDNAVDIINSNYNPAIDSLLYKNTVLQSKYDSLLLVKDSIAQQKSKTNTRKNIAKGKTQAADQRNDTPALVTALKNELAECENYSFQADQQLNVQGQMIQNLQDQNKNLYSENELHKSKFSALAKEYNSLEIKNNTNEKRAVKAEKKLKSEKTVKKILAAAIVVETFIIILK